MDKMKKKLIFAMSALLFSVVGIASVVAQPIEVRRVEGEIGAGMTVGLWDHSTPGPKINLELRYNLPKVPVDVGLHISPYAVYHNRIIDQHKDKDSNLALDLMVVSDYNFRRGQKLSFFAGAGLGVTAQSSPRILTLLSAMPRVGVEFSNHLRLTAAFSFSQREVSHFSLSVGGVFGGGPKKNRNK